MDWDGGVVPSLSQTVPDPLPTTTELPPMTTRSGRQRRVPKRFADFVPSSMKEIPSHMIRDHEERMARTAALAAPVPAVAQIDTLSQNDHSIDTGLVEDEDNEEPQFFNTEPNRFGVYRQYTVFPKVDPEANRSIDSVIDSPCFNKSSSDTESAGICAGLKGIGKNVSRGFKDNLYTPLKNFTVFLLMSWFYNGSTTKTVADFNILANDVMQHPLFHIPDLKGFDASTELDKLDTYDPTSETLTPEDGWKTSSVKIPVPKEGHKYPSESDALTFEVPGLHHRHLVDIIVETCKEPAAKTFHFTPHKLFWLRPCQDKPTSSIITSASSARKATVEDVPDNEDNTHVNSIASTSIPSPPHPSSSKTPRSNDPSSSSKRGTRSSTRHEDESVSEGTTVRPSLPEEPKSERIFSEIYNSDAMIEEHAKLNSQPREPDDPADLEYVTAPMIAYTDSTRLANFGGASLWPGYFFFGWQTKYERGKPSCFAAHHFAYFPTVSIFFVFSLH